MNEKPVKVQMDFNEALRRIAKTPKNTVVTHEEKKIKKNKKTKEESTKNRASKS